MGNCLSPDRGARWARTVVPGELSLQVVDFTANWCNGNTRRYSRAGFAGLELLFAASQHREWIWSMGDDVWDVRTPDSVKIPSVTAVGLTVRLLPSLPWQTCLSVGNSERYGTNPVAPRVNDLCLSLLAPKRFSSQALPVLWVPR